MNRTAAAYQSYLRSHLVRRGQVALRRRLLRGLVRDVTVLLLDGLVRVLHERLYKNV